MQGERSGELAEPDVWETRRELIPAGSVFALLAEHRNRLFPAGMFADVYPSPNGRPGMPPQVLAVVVMLQEDAPYAVDRARPRGGCHLAQLQGADVNSDHDRGKKDRGREQAQSASAQRAGRWRDHALAPPAVLASWR
jgi:hypothetical protein